MKTLKSWVNGAWHEADGGFRPLVNPSTEEEIARASTRGIDFGAVLDHARGSGGPALRSMGFAARGRMLKAMSGVVREHREELLELSRVNTGTTVADGAFDVDGASGTLYYYSVLAGSLGEGLFLPEDDGVQVGRSEALWVRHVLAPRRGVAVHVNAFNFPVWGFAEKAACALLAGMPVVTKPATATALVAERCVELVLDAGILPEGALQLVCGSTGDLLDRLGPQDVLAFTGSADTARRLARSDGVGTASARFNVEADSLNAAVLAPDASDTTFELAVRDIVREMTQKTGQKCTAVRRILAPADAADRLEEALAERLRAVVTGNPEDASVTMGPLATSQQLEDTLDGTAALAREANVVVGGSRRIDGIGSPAGTGYFVAPTLLRTESAEDGALVHEREVFGPVATLIPYDGSAREAAEVVARGGGMLVTSLYGDDRDWFRGFLEDRGSDAGRVYLGTESSAGEAPGSGVAFPHALHGGPGRAGGGHELGGLVGVRLYLQRVALQGAREWVDALVEGDSPATR